MNNYNGNDVKTLTPGQGYRMRIGMYLSADLQEAMDLGLRELIYNAQDEYAATNQENAQVKISIDTKLNKITVEDNLRGIPCELREDGINSLTAACLIPHSGAKYDDKTAYASSVGCNGQGLKVVCHTSKWLQAEIKRDGKIFYQSFHETNDGAVPDEDVKIIGETKLTGTKITYVPSEIVYGKDTRINIEVLSKTLKELSYFSRNFKIILIVDGIEQIFLSKNGLVDGLDTSIGISKPFQYFHKTNDCEVELALQWVGKNGKIRGYANGLEMTNGGKFITSFKTSLTRTFNTLAKTKFNGDNIRNILDGYVSVKVRVGQFSNQSKTSLANPEAGTATSTAISECLKEFYNSRPDDFKKVVDLLSRIDKAERAADRARDAVLNHTKEMQAIKKQKLAFIDKLSDAEVLGPDSILCICEGDSSGSSIAMGRDTKKYGILRIRGKMLNCLKADVEKILQNEEIKLLLHALGIDINNYNSLKLRYGKVAICADQDDDGRHIALLIMANLYKLCPQFLKENRLYWLQSPLFIEYDKNNNPKSWYYSDEDFNKVRKTVSGTIKRVKG